MKPIPTKAELPFLPAPPPARVTTHPLSVCLWPYSEHLVWVETSSMVFSVWPPLIAQHVASMSTWCGVWAGHHALSAWKGLLTHLLLRSLWVAPVPGLP